MRNKRAHTAQGTSIRRKPTKHKPQDTWGTRVHKTCEEREHVRHEAHETQKHVRHEAHQPRGNEWQKAHECMGARKACGTCGTTHVRHDSR